MLAGEANLRCWGKLRSAHARVCVWASAGGGLIETEGSIGHKFEMNRDDSSVTIIYEYLMVYSFSFNVG